MAGNLQFLIFQRLVAAHPLINGLISGSVDEEDAKRSFAEARSQTEFGNEELRQTSPTVSAIALFPLATVSGPSGRASRQIV